MLDRWTGATCRQAHILISRRLDRRLSPGERIRLWFHLRACYLCGRVDKHMTIIREAVQRLGR
jgi:hypothetical protein